MSTTATKPQIDPKLIVPFVAAVRNVMAKMLGLETTFDRPHIKVLHEPKVDYSGIIAFSGKLVGLVVVSFGKETAVRLVDKFTGMSIEPDTADFADAIGELANMIAGGAKKDLGANADISVPSVVMGCGHMITRPSDIPCLVVPCKTALGGFDVEICIKSV